LEEANAWRTSKGEKAARILEGAGLLANTCCGSVDCLCLRRDATRVFCSSNGFAYTFYSLGAQQTFRDHYCLYLYRENGAELLKVFRERDFDALWVSVVLTVKENL